MARSFSDILKSIGKKSKYQKQREATPGYNWVGTRSGPEYADIKEQQRLNREAGVTYPIYQGSLKSGEKLRNINGITYVVPAPSAAPATPAATSYSADFDSAGGPLPQGMFSPIQDKQQSMFGDYLQQQRTEPETTTDIVSKELAKITGTGQYDYAESPRPAGLMGDGGYSQGIRMDRPDNAYPQSVPFDQPFGAGFLSLDNMNQARAEIEQRNQENRDAYAARGEELRQQYLNRDNKRKGPSAFPSSSFNQRKARENTTNYGAFGDLLAKPETEVINYDAFGNTVLQPETEVAMSQNFDAFGTPISQPEQRVSMIDITPEEAAQGKIAPYLYSQEQTLPTNVNAPVEFDYEEKVPVNYDEFGNVIAEPQMSVASSARIIEPPVFSNTLVDFVKDQEGFKAEKYKDGDKNAIGYGHNLTAEEAKTNTVYGHDVSKPITEEIAQDILLKDLASKRKSLNAAIKKKYKDMSLEDLPLKSQEMLIDFQFNLGDAIGKFPKFTDAIIKGDIKTAKKEYKRYFGKRKIPLTKRNTDFYNTYLR